MNFIFRGTLVVSLKPAYNYSVLNLIQDVENVIEINQIIDIECTYTPISFLSKNFVSTKWRVSKSGYGE